MKRLWHAVFGHKPIEVYLKREDFTSIIKCECGYEWNDWYISWGDVLTQPEETITDDEMVARAIQQLADKRVVPGLLSPHATEVLTAIGKASGNITPAADYIFTLEQQLADLQAGRDRYREALEKIERKADSVAAGWIAAAALKSPSPIAPEEAQG